VSKNSNGIVKAIFGTESLVEIIRKVITTAIILSFSIPGVSVIIQRNIREVVIEEIAPVNQYIYNDISKLIDKNVSKIQKDPGDVKIADIETALNYWPMLKNSDMVNLPVLEAKIRILRKWYDENAITS
jgi:hypothetical protein